MTATNISEEPRLEERREGVGSAERSTTLGGVRPAVPVREVGLTLADVTKTPGPVVTDVRVVAIDTKYGSGANVSATNLWLHRHEEPLVYS